MLWVNYTLGMDKIRFTTENPVWLSQNRKKLNTKNTNGTKSANVLMDFAAFAQLVSFAFELRHNGKDSSSDPEKTIENTEKLKRALWTS